MSAAANGSALAVVEPSSSLEANVGTLMRRATDVAGVCREIVLKTAQTIQGRKYVRIEGWQAIAVAYGLVASARDVESVYDRDGKLIGVKAIGEVRRMSDGYVVSTAEGFVGVDEAVWFGGVTKDRDGREKRHEPRPLYAIRAMAQTRAESRACRGALSFVVTLIDSGLSTTPAEEMDGVVVEGTVTPPPPAKPAPRNTADLKAAMRPSPPQSVASAAQRAAEEPPPHEDADFRPDAERPAHIPTRPPTHDRTVTVPFGRNKGKTIAEVDEADLKYLQGAFQRDLDDPSKSRFHDKTRAQLAAVTGELAYRGL